ncbi:oligopeptidase A [Trifolium repens]|nr:putative cytosolic oligopeptidase A [Trifolium repens]WJX23835.1 oligopeptidase A [Trifolium repens]
MLTKEDGGLVAGIRGIEWDAVDYLLSSWKTDVTINCAARTYRAGSQSLRQLGMMGTKIFQLFISVVIIGHVFNVQPISDSKNLKQICDLYGRKCSRNTLQVQC